MRTQLLFAALLIFTGAAAQNSKYIKAVDEYVPAPGQFINTLPTATADDTPATMAAKCTERLADGAGQMVCLGAWGGYITFHFDHPVVNMAGAMDLYIAGNTIAGGSEPGIVMVSQDVNGNRLPDDPWYELSGSADTDSVGKVTYGYSVTYTRQDMQDVPWTDNQGNSGVVHRNGFHNQEYFPLWLPGELTFTGTLLPRNGVNTSPTGQNWVLSALRYGYVDNVPNADREGCCFNLDWAVDPLTREHVDITHADFIRVYCAQNQECEWLGETSTEVAGAEDLHPEAATGIDDLQIYDSRFYDSRFNTDGQIVNRKSENGKFLDLQGRRVSHPQRHGIYIVNGKKHIY